MMTVTVRLNMCPLLRAPPRGEGFVAINVTECRVWASFVLALNALVGPEQWPLKSLLRIKSDDFE